MKRFPTISDELLKALEAHFPDRANRYLGLTPAEMGALVGEQRVLDLLRRHHNQQNILEG